MVTTVKDLYRDKEKLSLEEVKKRAVAERRELLQKEESCCGKKRAVAERRELLWEEI
jgi:hypothetical protein